MGRDAPTCRVDAQVHGLYSNRHAGKLQSGQTPVPSAEAQVSCLSGGALCIWYSSSKPCVATCTDQFFHSALSSSWSHAGSCVLVSFGVCSTRQVTQGHRHAASISTLFSL